MASRKKEWMWVKSSSLQVFFQLLKHTESVGIRVAYNMLNHEGLQNGLWFISGAVYIPSAGCWQTKGQ